MSLTSLMGSTPRGLISGAVQQSWRRGKQCPIVACNTPIVAYNQNSASYMLKTSFQYLANGSVCKFSVCNGKSLSMNLEFSMIRIRLLAQFIKPIFYLLLHWKRRLFLIKNRKIVSLFGRIPIDFSVSVS